jgi:hypothetical protein
MCLYACLSTSLDTVRIYKSNIQNHINHFKDALLRSHLGSFSKKYLTDKHYLNKELFYIPRCDLGIDFRMSDLTI